VSAQSAMSSLIRHTHAAPAGSGDDHCVGDLLAHLGVVPDPRKRRGVRHAVATVLTVAAVAVAAGARSFAAIGEWVTDASAEALSALGVRRDPATGQHRPPNEATVRRVLGRVDADALDTAVGRWLAGRPQPPAPPTRPRLRALAIDGKTLRGSGKPGNQVHLLAVADHATTAVLGQVDVAGKTNEITRFQPLLDGLDLTGTVITADAMHTQREHADYLVTDKKAAYLLVVKRNQPSLYHQLKTLPWRDIPVLDTTRDRGHGRDEIRRLQVVTVIDLAFPHAVQAIRITRRVRTLGSNRWTTVTVYAITSLTVTQASPADLADYIRGHWSIEALHHIRDVTYTEDASQIRTGNGPEQWPPSATWPSAHSDSTGTPTSPKRYATTPAAPNDPSNSSASPSHSQPPPRLCRGPGLARPGPRTRRGAAGGGRAARPPQMARPTSQRRRPIRASSALGGTRGPR
jgi:predicted transposase YbfD/YdcC